LDLSCRKGYFEISKSIINNYPVFDEKEKSSEFPLHTACYEGAHEVVKLILQKGTPIDQLDHQNKNCLDIAIEKGHREVIRVLLNDPNWAKLIRLNDKIQLDSNSTQSRTSTSSSSSAISPDDDANNNNNTADLKIVISPSNTQTSLPSKLDPKEPIKVLECPEFSSMFDHKMWDIFKLILDKCVTEKEINFGIIDPPVKSIARHPLMLIARSGQESLLKHETTRMLLHLKWRIIPRCAFYFNLIVYMSFMFLFSLYSIDLSVRGAEILEENKYPNASSSLYMINNNRTSAVATVGGSNSSRDFLYENTRYNLNNYNYILIILLSFQIFKECMQIVFLDGLSYFLSSQNLIEIFTYAISSMSLMAPNYNLQSAYGSIAVLSTFILFPLFIQKLKIFGLYVVAFRRTLTNSAKFFPIFLIIFTGFILSFKIRSNFEVNYFNSTGYSLIRTFTMVVGELDTAKMGLYDGSVTNYVIYFMFIGNLLRNKLHSLVNNGFKKCFVMF
jgi:hypothetical protein